MPDKSEIAADARSLMRRAFKASLASLDSPSGTPYASLITVGTEPSGAPIFLISTLASARFVSHGCWPAVSTRITVRELNA